MKKSDSPRSPRLAGAGAHGDSFVIAPSGLVGTGAIENADDVESWLGYESIHPLTWVPGHSGADRGLRVE